MNCTNHPVDVRKMSLIAGGGLLLRDTSALGSSMGWAGVLPTSTRRQGFLAGLPTNIDTKRQCLPVLLPGTLHPRRVREGSLQPRLLFFYGVLGGGTKTSRTLGRPGILCFSKFATRLVIAGGTISRLLFARRLHLLSFSFPGFAFPRSVSKDKKASICPASFVLCGAQNSPFFDGFFFLFFSFFFFLFFVSVPPKPGQRIPIHSNLNLVPSTFLVP